MGKLERRILTKHWGFNTLTIIAIFVYMGLHTWIHLEIIYLFDAVLEGDYGQFIRKVLIFCCFKRRSRNLFTKDCVVVRIYDFILHRPVCVTNDDC